MAKCEQFQVEPSFSGCMRVGQFTIMGLGAKALQLIRRYQLKSIHRVERNMGHLKLQNSKLVVRLKLCIDRPSRALSISFLNSII